MAVCARNGFLDYREFILGAVLWVQNICIHGDAGTTVVLKS